MRGEIDETGVMIHYVIVAVDRGPLLLQEVVPLSHPADDRLEDLEERMHEVEHRLIVQGTKMAVDKLKQR
jgi:phosphoribosylglycinamide formyltransferase